MKNSFLSVVFVLAVATVTAPISAADDCVGVPPGLVGWWSGDNHARDLSGKFNLGNTMNVTYATGVVGTAFQFDGNSSSVKIAQSPSLNVQSLTLMAWINPADETYRPVMTYQQEYDFMGAFIWAGTPPGGAPGTLYANLRESPWQNTPIFASGVIPTNKWSLVAVTYDQAGGVNRLYVNGAIVKEANIGILTQRTAAPLYIGRLPETYDALAPMSFNGLIDEPQVYNRALSTAELSAIYAAGAAGMCKPQEPSVVQLQQATATFSQSNGDFSVAHAIDGNTADNLGWAIYPEIGAQTAVFETAADLGFSGGTDFSFRLVFNHISFGHGGPLSPQLGHTLGRFRISVTRDARDSFADGLPVGGDVTANWIPVRVRSASSELGATLTAMEDDSVLVSGRQGVADVYHIVAGTRLSGITGIRLEALPDPSLPVNGPGREHNGNFTVSEMTVTAQPGLAPEINQQPSSASVTAGGEANFTVAATSSLPLMYQWRYNGQALEGETNSTLRVQSAGSEHAGTYTVEVANREGSAMTAGAVLYVWPADVANAATLRVSNESPITAPVSDIATNLLSGPSFLAQAYAGGNSEALEKVGPAVPFLSSDDAGFFAPIELVLTNVAQGSNVFVQVRAWEAAGGATYEAAMQRGAQYGASAVIESATGGGPITTPELAGLAPFSLVAAPRISANPEDKFVYVGQDASFTVQPWGSQPFTFTWFFNSNSIAGASASSLALTNVQLEQAGEYFMVLSNSVGAVTSSVAVLTVEMPDVTPPVITLASPLAGSTYDVAVTLSGTVSDNKAIASLVWSRTGIPAVEITSTNGEFSVADIPLVRGPNLFTVTATDTSTNSSTVEVIVTNVPSRTLAVGSIPAHQEGSRVAVPILLTSRGEVGGAAFDLTYDRFQLVEPEVQWNEVPGGAITSFSTNVTGRVRASFALSGTTLPTGIVHIATITFRAMSVSRSPLSLPLGLSSVGLYGGDGRELPQMGTQVKPGTVVITRREFIGDNNANDRLDINDATVIMRYVTFPQEQRPWDPMLNDLNSNRQLDVGDVTLVLRTVVGLDPQPTNRMTQPMRPAARAFAASNGRISLIADKQKAAPGDKVRVTLRMKDFSGPLSGLSFRVQYPAAALKLDDASAHRVGEMVPNDAIALWNVAPSQNNYAAQNGSLAVAIMSAQSWMTNSGEVAELTFTVQDTADDQFSWPITVGAVEVSSGFDLISVAGAEIAYLGRDAVPSLFGSVPFYSEGGFSLSLSTEAGAEYRIEVSEDLVTWTLLTGVEGTGGLLTVTDEDAEREGQRFYRAIQVE